MASSGRGQLKIYRQDKGEDLYRRGMYTFIKLTVPPPSMILFDGSNRDQCEVKRSQTNTPLQALIMMNDPTVLEAARVLAQKLMTENMQQDDKIKTAFHRIICRVNTPKEYQIIKKYYNDQLLQFKLKKLNASVTLEVGEFPLIKNIDLDATAALMKVITLIYNMEEAILKS